MTNLTHAEKTLILASLWAVTPTGGGSPQFHLANKLNAEWQIDLGDEFWPKVGHLQTRAHEEFLEGNAA